MWKDGIEALNIISSTNRKLQSLRVREQVTFTLRKGS